MWVPARKHRAGRVRRVDSRAGASPVLSASAEGEASRRAPRRSNSRASLHKCRDFALPAPRSRTFSRSDMAESKRPREAPAAWSGRFSEPVSDRVKRYTSSVEFDCRLAEADIAGSLAHARMLRATGVLASEDLGAIERGMQAIRAEIERGEFPW